MLDKVSTRTLHSQPSENTFTKKYSQYEAQQWLKHPLRKGEGLGPDF